MTLQHTIIQWRERINDPGSYMGRALWYSSIGIASAFESIAHDKGLEALVQGAEWIAFWEIMLRLYEYTAKKTGVVPLSYYTLRSGDRLNNDENSSVT